MLEKEEMDAVFICTPTHTHTDLSLACIDKGIDFFVENNLDSLYIFVLSYQFLPKNDSLTISKLDLDSLDLVTIEALFQGTINIGGIIYRNVLPTGTWTYLYINNNNTWLRVANETIINELFSFYHLVCENINKD